MEHDFDGDQSDTSSLGELAGILSRAISSFSERLSSIDSRLDGVEMRLDGIEDRMSSLERKVDMIGMEIMGRA